jgi:hypothetical protein
MTVACFWKGRAHQLEEEDDDVVSPTHEAHRTVTRRDGAAASVIEREGAHRSAALNGPAQDGVRGGEKKELGSWGWGNWAAGAGWLGHQAEREEGEFSFSFLSQISKSI